MSICLPIFDRPCLSRLQPFIVALLLPFGFVRWDFRYGFFSICGSLFLLVMSETKTTVAKVFDNQIHSNGSTVQITTTVIVCATLWLRNCGIVIWML